MSGSTAPAVDPALAPPLQTPGDWSKGLDSGLLGHATLKGWDLSDPAKAFAAAAQAHQSAEQYIGIPANDLMKLPKPGDSDGWAKVYQRLGTPADPKEYDFSTVKLADGTAPDQAFQDFARATAASLHLAKDAAPLLAQAIVKFRSDIDAAKTVEDTAALANERAALDRNWGAAKAQNLVVAQRAAEALGVEAATVQALEGQVGYAKVMEMFRLIGSKIGEDNFIPKGVGGGPAVVTREGAAARKQELLSNPDWSKRYLAGGQAENRELQSLLALIVGDDTEASRMG